MRPFHFSLLGSVLACINQVTRVAAVSGEMLMTSRGKCSDLIFDRWYTSVGCEVFGCMRNQGASTNALSAFTDSVD